MRISDWSSDVCSSDLGGASAGIGGVAGETSDGRIPGPSPPRAAAMITLLVLDAARDCLRRPRDPPNCICRAPKHHAGPQEYVPVDMVVVPGDEEADHRLEQPVADRGEAHARRTTGPTNRKRRGKGKK